MNATMSQDKSIWILDSNKQDLELFKGILDVRYRVQYFSSLDDFSTKIKNSEARPSLIISDLKFENSNLVNYLTNYSTSSFSSIPLLICSSFDDMDAIRFSYECGVVDFLTKPIRKNEFLVKIDNILSGKNIFVSSPLSSDKVLTGFSSENLTSKQTKLLKLFVSSPTKVINRSDILKSVWGDTVVHPKTVDVHLYNLRRKIKDKGYSIKSQGGGKWILLSEAGSIAQGA